MADLYMPDVEVHVAFNAGYTTPAASRVWTDVSSYVELADKIKIGFGRKDEQSTAGPNDLNLTLDNTDGRFTAGRAASPYYPNVRLGRPIRVQVTPPGGTTSIRFVGFIDEWPVEWESGTDKYAKAKIRATSRQARLGLSANLRSSLENEFMQDRPAQYLTLGDPAGSTQAADSSGQSVPPMTTTAGAPIVFGNAIGPGTDDLTAAEFAGGQYLQGSELTGRNYWGASFFFLRTGTPAATEALFAVRNQSGNTVAITLNTGGFLEVLENGASVSLIHGGQVCDGGLHHVALSVNLSLPFVESRLYVDGIEVDTSGGIGSNAPVQVLVGGAPGYATLTGVMAHVAYYSASGAQPLAAARVAAHAAAGLTGLPVESSSQRLLRILGWVRVAATEVDAETGVQLLTTQETNGQSVIDALRLVESSEDGVLFDGADGNIKFHNRSHRYLATPVATLNMASHHVGADYSPKLDRSALVNDAEVSNPTTGEKARSNSTTSSDEYGKANASAESVANTYDPLQQKAAWLIASYSEPRTRVSSLTVDVLAHQGLTPSAQTLLGVTIGDLLAVTNAPTQADTTSQTYFVEGTEEEIGPESYEISYNLSPTYPTLNTLVLDSPTRGQLNAGLLLAL